MYGTNEQEIRPTTRLDQILIRNGIIEVRDLPILREWNAEALKA